MTVNVLLVSKPVEPPWNDSSKNLARDLGAHLHRYQGLTLTKPGPQMADLGRARALPVYQEARLWPFTPPLPNQWPVLSHLLRERESQLWHFFFAPNLRTSSIARACATLRGRRTVQTVCSAPAADENLHQALFADQVVVLSRHTYRRFRSAGIAGDRLTSIPPCIPPLAVPSETQRLNTRREHGLPSDGALLLYPGDLEFSKGAERALLCLAGLPTAIDTTLVFCCRTKTPAAVDARHTLRARAQALNLQQRVHFIGETPAIHKLLHAADVVLLPAEHLYAKMDLPLVLLEAMALMRPVVVLAGTAAAELAAEGGALLASDEIDDLIATVVALLEDDEGRAVIGARARAQVQAKYEPSAMARAYEVLYDRVLNA